MSAQLVYSMAKNGVFWVGTISAHNRCDVPKYIMKGSAQADKLPRSHCLWMHTEDGTATDTNFHCSTFQKESLPHSESMQMLTWSDAQAVSILHSVPFISSETKLGQKYLAKRRVRCTETILINNFISTITKHYAPR